MEDRFTTDAAGRKCDLVPGTLAMLILQAIRGRAMHGAGVAQFIHHTSQNVLTVEEGALYPALHRLESRGLLESKWGVSENRRRAKFYRLTAAGTKELSNENARWTRVTEGIRRIMENG